MFNRYKDFQVQATRIASDYKKGRVNDDDARDACSSYKDFVDDLAASYPDEDFTEEVTSYAYNPANVAIYIKEIVADMTDLLMKAFRLMMENMKKPESPESEGYKNEAPAPQKENRVYEGRANDSKKTKQFEGDAPVSMQEKNNNKITGQYDKSRTSNLIMVKTTEQRQREQAQQRAAQRNASQSKGAQSFESAPESAFEMSAS